MTSLSRCRPHPDDVGPQRFEFTVTVAASRVHVTR